MTYVLGLGGSNHDFSASLLRNGVPISFIEDERITRKRYGHKHWIAQSCRPSSEYVCKSANINIADVDHLFISNDIEGYDRFWESRKHQVVGHHLCHASAAFYTSPFAQASILVIDGKGGPIAPPSVKYQSFETISMGSGNESSIELETVQKGEHQIATSSWSYVSSNSIGWFYSIVTECVGMGENGEGKTMALASYGQPRFKPELMDFIKVSDEAIFEFSPYSGLWTYLIETIKREQNSFSIRADIAASAQSILEDVIVLAAKRCKRQFGGQYLVYGGGVALNGVANHRIRQESGFKDMFLYPASGDNGLSMGAALYGHYHLLEHTAPKKSLERSVSFAFGGRKYSSEEIKEATLPYSVSLKEFVKTEDLLQEMTDKLTNGEVLAVFQGSSEFGPRALGNRSLIALPSTPNIQRRLNQIKRRESFRPFAPIVTEEDVGTYFNLDSASPFMLEIAPVREEYRAQLAGVCHIDGSARVQTIATYQKSLIRQLLEYLKKQNLVPVIVNTSFNLKGAPIVETPANAMDSFIKLEVSSMVMGNYLIEKQTQLSIEEDGMTRHAY